MQSPTTTIVSTRYEHAGPFQHDQKASNYDTDVCSSIQPRLVLAIDGDLNLTDLGFMDALGREFVLGTLSCSVSFTTYPSA